MIIVSQDKRLITESLAISIEDIGDKEEKKIMTQEYCGKLYLLGVYATEERAKEVMKDIIDKYEDIQILKYSRESFATRDNFVYRMPKE